MREVVKQLAIVFCLFTAGLCTAHGDWLYGAILYFTGLLWFLRREVHWRAITEGQRTVLARLLREQVRPKN